MTHSAFAPTHTSRWPLRLLAAAIVASGAIASAAFAQDQPPNGFPSDSTTPSAPVLRDYLAGKTLVGQYANGATVTTKFSADGKLNASISTGGIDSGDWNAQDGKLCGTLRKSGTFCNDARFSSGTLWMRRMSGEIVRYEAR